MVPNERVFAMVAQARTNIVPRLVTDFLAGAHLDPADIGLLKAAGFFLQVAGEHLLQGNQGQRFIVDLKGPEVRIQAIGDSAEDDYRDKVCRMITRLNKEMDRIDQCGRKGVQDG